MKLIDKIKKLIKKIRGFENVNKFTADFETATWLEDETYVWAWASCDIEEDFKIELGNNIDSFMEWCYENHNCDIYFHNLKFDGEFIIYWLLTHDFKYVEEKEDIEDKTFTVLINDLGQFYNITVYYKKYKKRYDKVSFIDSLKIIPFSVDVIAKSFGLEESKLVIDYNKPRSRNHVLTIEEKEYIKNDVLIVAKALRILFDEDLTKMTQGSNALSDFKKMIGKRRFDHYFPNLEKAVDDDIRQSYKRRFYVFIS